MPRCATTEVISRFWHFVAQTIIRFWVVQVRVESRERRNEDLSINPKRMCQTCVRHGTIHTDCGRCDGDDSGQRGAPLFRRSAMTLMILLHSFQNVSSRSKFLLMQCHRQEESRSLLSTLRNDKSLDSSVCGGSRPRRIVVNIVNNCGPIAAAVLQTPDEKY